MIYEQFLNWLEPRCTLGLKCARVLVLPNMQSQWGRSLALSKTGSDHCLFNKCGFQTVVTHVLLLSKEPIGATFFSFHCRCWSRVVVQVFVHGTWQESNQAKISVRYTVSPPAYLRVLRKSIWLSVRFCDRYLLPPMHELRSNEGFYLVIGGG